MNGTSRVFSVRTLTIAFRPMRSLLSRLSTLQLTPTKTHIPLADSSRPPISPIRPRKRIMIITTQYFMSNKLGAELYFRAARRTASIAAERCRRREEAEMADIPSLRRTLDPNPISKKAALPLPPPTPAPIAGSSPFVKAQRHIHHIRFGSMEVKSRARDVLRERILRGVGGRAS